MSQRVTTAELLDRWRTGDQQAAEEIYQRYAEPLLNLAKGQIGQRLGRKESGT